MVSFEDAISVLKDNAGFKPNNYGDSYYRLYETSKGCIQVRVSNHGTELWTWVKNAPINPSDCYANICIVLSYDGNHASNTTADMNIYKKDESGKNILDYGGKRIVDGRIEDFEVIQYVYNLSLLSSRNMGIINAMIQQIPTKNKFYEPLQTNPTKHAKIFKLTPNKPEELIKEDMKKNVVKINENALRQMIAESVKKVLSEIADTPEGRYAVAAVQGRAHARMQKARKDDNDAEYYKQRQVFDDAEDAMSKGREEGYPKANKATYGGDMARADDKGFKYGFKRGKMN